MKDKKEKKGGLFQHHEYIKYEDLQEPYEESYEEEYDENNLGDYEQGYYAEDYDQIYEEDTYGNDYDQVYKEDTYGNDYDQVYEEDTYGNQYDQVEQENDYVETYENEYEDSYEEDSIEQDYYEDEPPINFKKIIVTSMVIAGTIMAVLVLGMIGFKVIKLFRGEIDPLGEVSDNVSQTTSQEERLEQTVENGEIALEVPTEEITNELVEIKVSKDVPEVEKNCFGIDVSKYQGVINWQKVKESGIEFAMIRVGYRTLDTGEIKEDDFGRYNLQEATACGIKVGVYFFSTAISEQEAEEEALWTINMIKNYPITYPVAYNSEGYDKASNRHYGYSAEDRTSFAMKYLDTIYEAGYTPMLYASNVEMTGDRDWIVSKMEKQYKIWVSQYVDEEQTESGRPTYDGLYGMWQFTSKGKVDGIHTEVDKNVGYFGYDAVASAHDLSTPPEHQTADYTAFMQFTDMNYTATAKIETNLRDIPDQGEESHVMYTLKNGEKVTVTGVSETGWARLDFNGNTYYAVKQYLIEVSAEETPQNTPQTETPEENVVVDDNGIKTIFTDCNEQMTAKIEVNLRKLPSVTNPDAIVIATIQNGEVVTRTGYNTEHGWSRVEYNGQVLYCVSSYLTPAQ